MSAAAPRLRLIQAPGVGYEGIDLEAAAERGIPVTITVCGDAVPVAEFTIMAMLAVSRRLIELGRELRRGHWMAWDRRLQSFDLKGKTLGIVGFRLIGREVTARAGSFDMRILCHDARMIPPPYQQVDLDTLLALSDYVPLHVPSRKGTRKLLDRNRLARMKTGAILVNTSRGEVVDGEVLIEALRSGKLLDAALDVFEQQPPAPNNPLLMMDNVVLTPHVASGAAEALRVKARAFAENMRHAGAGKDPSDCILQPKGTPA